jgi:hypothetical protein
MASSTGIGEFPRSIVEGAQTRIEDIMYLLSKRLRTSFSII